MPTLTRRHLLAGAAAIAACAAMPAAVATGREMALHSIVVTTAEFPIARREYVLRHAERFWIARVLCSKVGPASIMPSHVVTWDVDPDRESEADARVRNIAFALDARATEDEALRWHLMDEQHYRDHGYAPNHWSAKRP